MYIYNILNDILIRNIEDRLEKILPELDEEFYNIVYIYKMVDKTIQIQYNC